MNKQIESLEYRLKYYENKTKSAICFKDIEKYLKRAKRVKNQIKKLKKL